MPAVVKRQIFISYATRVRATGLIEAGGVGGEIVDKTGAQETNLPPSSLH